ncbi:MAG: HD domain-containing phosphohydrolase [Planctomycetota bacterium]|jgi:putative two-component system response regulator
MQNDKNNILIVDDEESICDIISDYLELRDFNCFTANSVDTAIDVLNNRRVDCIVSDIKMPGRSGLDLLKTVMADWPELAVVLITGHGEINTAVMAMQEGAYDFILKPIQLEHIAKSVSNALEKKKMKSELDNYQKNLEELVEKRTTQINGTLKALKSSHLETINILANAAEFRDDETGSHVLRISRYCEILAGGLKMPKEQVWTITKASPLHDIGKIGIPDSILLKPAPLTSAEFEIMKNHASIGREILKNTKSNLLKVAEQIAGSHHEKWDGTGYPTGASQKNIPVPGRITALADVFDALTMKRCYKPAFSVEKSVEIMREGKGTHFDPEILEIFMNNLEDIKAVYLTYKD